MMLKSFLTSALLALSLGSEAVSAGRFAQKAQLPLQRAKHVVQQALGQKHHHESNNNFRFLDKNTQRE